MQRGAWRERVVAIRGDIAESSDDESHSDYQSTGFYTVDLKDHGWIPLLDMQPKGLRVRLLAWPESARCASSRTGVCWRFVSTQRERLIYVVGRHKKGPRCRAWPSAIERRRGPNFGFLLFRVLY